MSAAAAPRLDDGRKQARLKLAGKELRLTNLDKPFWPDRGISKGALIQYYADVSEHLLPHLVDRAMVMKRYPHGWQGKHFFMKRTPEHAPEWIETCSIEHGSGSVIDFPMAQDLPSLLWLIQLGCIDLNPWYARCDDTDRPDYLHFDLDPVPDAGFEEVREAGLMVKEALDALGLPSFPKTTGSRGIHVYIPIARGPTQKEVWTFAKSFALAMEDRHPELLTAEYRIKNRPKDHVLVDYNQNAWGRTLASVYSVRPNAFAGVSTPVTWDEVEEGARPEDFRLDNVRERIADLGDLWRPLTWPKKGRVELRDFM